MSAYEVRLFQQALVATHHHEGDCDNLPNFVCRMALGSALDRLIADGVTDDEIRVGASYPMLALRTRATLDQMLAELRGERPTEYARQKIAEAPQVFESIRRRTGRTPSKAAVVTQLGVSHSQFYVWLGRGLLRWPPQ